MEDLLFGHIREGHEEPVDHVVDILVQAEGGPTRPRSLEEPEQLEDSDDAQVVHLDVQAVAGSAAIGERLVLSALAAGDAE